MHRARRLSIPSGDLSGSSGVRPASVLADAGARRRSPAFPQSSTRPSSAAACSRRLYHCAFCPCCPGGCGPPENGCGRFRCRAPKPGAPALGHCGGRRVSHGRDIASTARLTPLQGALRSSRCIVENVSTAGQLSDMTAMVRSARTFAAQAAQKILLGSPAAPSPGGRRLSMVLAFRAVGGESRSHAQGAVRQSSVRGCMPGAKCTAARRLPRPGFVMGLDRHARVPPLACASVGRR